MGCGMNSFSHSDQWWALVNTVMNFRGPIKCWELLEWLSNYWIVRNYLFISFKMNVPAPGDVQAQIWRPSVGLEFRSRLFASRTGYLRVSAPVVQPLAALPTHPVAVFIIAVLLMFPEVSKLPTVICCLVPQSFTKIDCALTHFPFKLLLSEVS